jgi:hypothetical protein
MALTGRHFEEAYKKPQLLRKEVAMYGKEAPEVWSSILELIEEKEYEGN